MPGSQPNLFKKKSLMILWASSKIIESTLSLRCFSQRSRSSSGSVNVIWIYGIFVGSHSLTQLIRLSHNGFEHEEQILLLQVKKKYFFVLQSGHEKVENHSS